MTSSYQMAYDHMDGHHNPKFEETCYECWKERAKILATSAKSFESALQDAYKEIMELRSQLKAPKEYGDWLKEARAEGYEQLRSDFQVKMDEREAHWRKEYDAVTDQHYRLYNAAYEAKVLVEDFVAWGGDYKPVKAVRLLQEVFV